MNVPGRMGIGVKFRVPVEEMGSRVVVEVGCGREVVACSCWLERIVSIASS